MESTLSLKYEDLRARVGFFLGYGRGDKFGETAWTTPQTNDVNECVSSGEAQFYNPPPVEGVIHRWSFLRPTTSLTLAQDATTVDCPDDFGGIEGQVTVSAADSQMFMPVPVTGEGRIRELYARFPSATGQPEWVAERPIKGTQGKEGQRFQLYVYPTADVEYTLGLTYYVLPSAISGIRPFSYGGMAHAETILESCLAIAEQRFDQMEGVHTLKFRERLAASIAEDNKHKPALLGYNRDRSDAPWFDWRQRYLGSRVTVNGVQY